MPKFLRKFFQDHLASQGIITSTGQSRPFTTEKGFCRGSDIAGVVRYQPSHAFTDKEQLARRMAVAGSPNTDEHNDPARFIPPAERREIERELGLRQEEQTRH